MTHYERLISDATGVTNMEDIQEIEDYMRHVIYSSTLDWQTREQLNNAAQNAWLRVQYFRTPEGIAMLAGLMPPI